jgi:hypothetical protein
MSEKSMVCKPLALMAVALLLVDASPHALAGADQKARAVLAAVKAASGGAHWDELAELDQQGLAAEGGQSGPWRQALDLKRGRYASYSTLGGVAAGEGYDGEHGWFMDEKSMVSVRDAIQARRETATQAYIARQGWLRSASADPASMQFVGLRQEAGHAFAVVRIVPRRGSGIELWVDAQRHLIDRIITSADDGETQTTWYADYRPVAGVLLPYLQRSGNGDAQYDTTIRLQHVTALKTARDADFRRPASAVHDAYIEHGATNASVPFISYGGLIVVAVSIDGAPPLPFVLDTGGLNLLTPAAARKLGIEGLGHQAVQGVGEAVQAMQVAQVKRYRLGQVVLEDQRFLIVSLPQLLTDRGAQEPIAGLIGYELLRRFATRIDYDHHMLTFTPNQAFEGMAGQTPLPLAFNERTPQVTASIDGVPGVFSLDTGDSGGLTVFEPFARAHGIRKLGKVLATQMRGAGGKIVASEAHVETLALGPFSIAHPLATFAAPAKGVFASSVLGGNLGYDVLSQFVLTFDYEHRRLYLQRGQRFASAQSHGYSGLGLDRRDHQTLVVATVAPDSPAQTAGLRVGDQVTAINGTPASQLGLDDLRGLAMQPAGTRVTLYAMRNGVPRTYAVTLQNRP